MFVLLCKTVEAATFKSIVFDITAAALLLAILLRITRSRRKRREAPVFGKGCIDHIDVRIIEA